MTQGAELLFQINTRLSLPNIPRRFPFTVDIENDPLERDGPRLVSPSDKKTTVCRHMLLMVDKQQWPYMARSIASHDICDVVGCAVGLHNI